MVIVGTKTDLRTDPSRKPPDAEPFQPADGERLAQEGGAKMYVECSSFTQDGLKKVFEQAVRVALAAQAPQTTPGSTGKKSGICTLL